MMNSIYRQRKYAGMAGVALTMLAAVVLLAGIAVPAQTQTETVLYSFGGSPSSGPDGAYRWKRWRLSLQSSRVQGGQALWDHPSFSGA